MIKIKNKEKGMMCFAQIFILITASFAFSFLVNEYTSYGDPILVEDNNFKLFGRISKFSDLFNGFQLVSAQFDSCCEVTTTGFNCQTTDISLCDPNYQSSPTQCEFTSFCQLGCCISPETGLCSAKTSKLECENRGGVFKNDESCNVQECRKGCCVVGAESLWTTETNCAWEGNTQNQDLPTDWRTDVGSELQCLLIAEGGKEGACVLEDDDERKCILTSLDDCFQKTGSENNFYGDRFCSDPELETSCEAKDHKECIVGEEDVYWIDSCGNKEDIAEDCDFFRGDYCGEVGNEIECKDIRCDTDGDGQPDRENGESWCSYDAAIGDGKDTVGSRHIKHICHMGTERISACADFRNEICVEEQTNLDGKEFSQAACRVNQWRTCMAFNGNQEALKPASSGTGSAGVGIVGNSSSSSSSSSSGGGDCVSNPDCRLKHIDMDGPFSFSVCLPNYPPGFDLNDFNPDATPESVLAAQDRVSQADNICDTATQKCTEIWECGLIGGCECKVNCDCHTAKFTQEMNDFCVSLGDCGAYINYVGEFTDQGYTVRAEGGDGPPRLGLAQFGYSTYTNKPSQPADPGDFANFENLNPESLPAAQLSDDDNLSAFENELLSAAGAYGNPLLLTLLKEDGTTTEVDVGLISQGPIGLSQFTSAFASSNAQGAVASQIGDPDGDGDNTAAMIGAVAAGLITQMITSSILFSLIAGLLLFLLLFKKIKKVHIYFTCLPWEPPAGGEDCNKCNQADVPCTEYRCESLGQLCHIINKGTDDQLCVSRPENENFPSIKPFENALSEGYKYHNVNNDGFEIVNASNEGCIEPYTPVDIGIIVDPFAKCRVGTDASQDYSEMVDTFGPKGNSILPAHLMKVFIPSPEAFKNTFNLTDEQVRDIGKVDYYVKCKTASGKINPGPYKIKTCVNPGPDLTPPRITRVNPASGAFVKYGETEQPIVVYVNEPSQCRYSQNDVDFDSMENELTCETDVTEYGIFGLPCTGTIAGVDQTDKFYIRCKDISENGNEMTESFVYEINPSESPLTIDEVIPKKNEEFTVSVEPATTNLRIRTSGGANSGEAICKWEGNGFGDSFVYEEEFGDNTHEYQLSSLVKGTYNINFMCEDQAGNIAENSTSFRIKVDKFGPKITRIYFENGLKISTSEKAECRYDFNRNYIFENATKMGNDQGLNHFSDWFNSVFYIQCKDEFDNKGVRLRIKPYG